MKYILAIICALALTSCAVNKAGDMGKTINQLSSVDSVTAADLFVVYATATSGDARKAAMSVLQTYLQANLTFGSDDSFTVQREAAGGFGFAVVLTGSDNIMVILEDASTQDVSFNWFNDGLAVDGQEVIVVSVSTSNVIGFVGDTPNTNGWPTGTPPNLMADAENPIRFKYVLETDTWYRIS